ncbi:sensor histidine kinase [Streptomyces sp. NPDC059009]|uniref:sensor histidine kinase n=1 Tax=Streptomyces sp. NPDC059009 TaxID=3346694 RepID=UPI0036ADE398
MSATLRPPISTRPPPGVRTALAWLAALAFPVLAGFAAILSEDSPNGLQLLGPALAAVLTFPLLRRRPLPALLLLLVGAAAATLLVPEPSYYNGVEMVRQERTEWYAYPLALAADLAVAHIAATRRRWLSLTAAALTFLSQVGTALVYAHGPNAQGSSALLLLLAVTTSWFAGDARRQRRDHAETLRAQAVAAERLRIARELHDMVAHSIGIIAIQAGVGRRVIDTQPAEARASLRVIEDTSRDTLSGLRRMLGALRRAEPDGGGAESVPLDPTPGLADLDRLVAAARDAGVEVDVRLWGAGPERGLPAELDLSAYRIVQEAVTNVVRHAGTGRCRVTVDRREKELGIEITDDGRGGVVSGSGYGLVGMRERVALHGGEFTAGPRPEGGFRVAALLPVPVEVTR